MLFYFWVALFYMKPSFVLALCRVSKVYLASFILLYYYIYKISVRKPVLTLIWVTCLLQIWDERLKIYNFLLITCLLLTHFNATKICYVIMVMTLNWYSINMFNKNRRYNLMVWGQRQSISHVGHFLCY